eukprot:m.14186 g.14186  ORF g.14186 m.14186 type:complete len:811 (-) comp4271_c0_seq1:243-2675(-)
MKVEGVDCVELHGIPGGIALFGETCQALLVDGDEREVPFLPRTVVGATATVPKSDGRVFAMSHEGYWNKLVHAPESMPNAAIFLRQVVVWLSKTAGDCEGRVATIAVKGKQLVWAQKLLDHLQLSQSLQLILWKDRKKSKQQPAAVLWMGKKGSGDVCMLDEREDQEWMELVAFVRNGGGMMVCMCPWGFEQITSASLRTECAQNHVLRAFGLAFTTELCSNNELLVLAEKDGERGVGNLLKILQRIAGMDLAEKYIMPSITSVCNVLHQLPIKEIERVVEDTYELDIPTHAFLRLCEEFLEIHGTPTSKTTISHPVTTAPSSIHSTQFTSQALSALPQPKHDDYKQSYKSEATSSDEGPYKASAKLLKSSLAGVMQKPGIIAEGAVVFPGMKRDISTIQMHQICVVNASSKLEEWVSTGLYVVPGAEMHIKIKEGVEANWKIRVGCHKDLLWSSKQWNRWPDITKSYAINESMICNPWGGPLYLEHTHGTQHEEKLVVEVTNVGKMGQFVLGHTTQEDWEEQHAQAPWVELEGKHIIFTIPEMALSSKPILNTVENLTLALNFWDTVIVNHYQLVGSPAPERKERFVADVQISAGYLHSGYPVMAHLDQIFHPNDEDPMLFEGKRLWNQGNWGIFHELGHHIQDRRWTFEGTGEVTVNFFTLYSMDKVVGILPWHHPWLQRHKRKASLFLKDTDNDGNRFRTWQQDPGLALCTFASLQHVFGWDIFEKCFLEYNRLKGKFEPNRLEEQVQGFVWFLSWAVNTDLRPYFQTWSWPLSPDLEGNDHVDMNWDSLQPLSDDIATSLLDMMGE